MKSLHWAHFVCINAEKVEEIRKDLLARKSQIWTFEGREISCTLSFLRQADKDFPHATHLSCHENWDAFNDWFWSELSLLQHDEGVKEVVIFWLDAQDILDSGNLQDFLLVVQSISSVFEQLKGLQLRVYLVGHGKYFDSQT